MAEDIENVISYYLLIDGEHKEDLASLREWTNLKVAFDTDMVWLTNFDLNQIESIRVKQIPHKKVFYSNDGKLFLLNSLLPWKNEPNLLWTPIERAFPLTLSELNHNYFGIEEQFEIKLIREEQEKKGEVLLVSSIKLQDYIETAPEYRLKKINWVILNNTSALLFGTPLLPIDGEAFWLNSNSILPVGYNFELNYLIKSIELKIEPLGEYWIVWNKDCTYFKVDKAVLKPLSKASFSRSISIQNNLENQFDNVS